MMPALAMIGAMLTPISLSIIVATIASTMPVTMLLSRLPMVCGPLHPTRRTGRLVEVERGTDLAAGRPHG